MRKIAPWLVFLLTFGMCLAVAMPALADDDDWDDDEEEEAESAWGDYGESVGTRSLMGVTSLITWPADPVMDTVFPPDEFNELPAGPIIKYPLGLAQGTLLSVYRLGMGTLDLLLSPVTPLKMLSPEPRWYIFDIEHDEY